MDDLAGITYFVWHKEYKKNKERVLNHRFSDSIKTTYGRRWDDYTYI